MIKHFCRNCNATEKAIEVELLLCVECVREASA